VGGVDAGTAAGRLLGMGGMGGAVRAQEELRVAADGRGDATHALQEDDIDLEKERATKTPQEEKISLKEGFFDLFFRKKPKEKVS